MDFADDDDIDPDVVWSKFGGASSKLPDPSHEELDTTTGEAERATHVSEVDAVEHGGADFGYNYDCFYYELEEPPFEDGDDEIQEEPTNPPCRFPSDFVRPTPTERQNEGSEWESEAELVRLASSLNEKLMEVVKRLVPIVPAYEADLERIQASFLPTGANKDDFRRLDPLSSGSGQGKASDYYKNFLPYIYDPSLGDNWTYFAVNDVAEDNAAVLPREEGIFAETLKEMMRGWKSIDQKKLNKCILEEAIDEEYIRLERDLELLREGGPVDSAVISSIVKRLDELENPHELDFAELVGSRDRRFNWARIASQDLAPAGEPDDGEHFQPEAVALLWRNVMHPSIKQSPWTIEEDLRLRSLVCEKSMYAWEEIAEEIGNGRTPYSCACRFQGFHNTGMRDLLFSRDEDRDLMRLADDWQSSKLGIVDWEHVTDAFDSVREPSELRRRYFDLTRPQLLPGPPKVRDFASYFVFVELFADDPELWAEITRLKDPYVLREAFVRKTEKFAKACTPRTRKKWRKADDRMLMHSVVTCGTKGINSDSIRTIRKKFTCSSSFLQKRLILLRKVLVEEKGTLSDSRLRSRESCMYECHERTDTEPMDVEQAFALAREALEIARRERALRSPEWLAAQADKPYALSPKYHLFRRAMMELRVPNKSKLGGGVKSVRWNQVKSGLKPMPFRPFATMPFISIAASNGRQLVTSTVAKAAKILTIFGLVECDRVLFNPLVVEGERSFVPLPTAVDLQRGVGLLLCWFRVNTMVDPELLAELKARLENREEFYRLTGGSWKHTMEAVNSVTPKGYNCLPPLCCKPRILREALAEELLGRLSEESLALTADTCTTLRSRTLPSESMIDVAPLCEATMVAYKIYVQSARGKLPVTATKEKSRAKPLPEHPVSDDVRRTYMTVRSFQNPLTLLKTPKSSAPLTKTPVIIGGLDVNKKAEMGDVTNVPIFVTKPVVTYARKRPQLPAAVVESNPPPLAARSLSDLKEDARPRRPGIVASSGPKSGYRQEDEKSREGRRRQGLSDVRCCTGHSSFPALSPEESEEWLKDIVNLLFTGPHVTYLSCDPPSAVRPGMSSTETADAAAAAALSFVEVSYELGLDSPCVDSTAPRGRPGKHVPAKLVEEEEEEVFDLMENDENLDWEMLEAEDPGTEGMMEFIQELEEQDYGGSV